MGRDELESPRKRGFARISKAPGDITMRARRTPIAKTFSPQNWLASNEYLTSCRTRRSCQQLFRIDPRGRDLSMRTMIPLRVFGILTNIILIASAIPARNYPTLML